MIIIIINYYDYYNYLLLLLLLIIIIFIFIFKNISLFLGTCVPACKNGGECIGGVCKCPSSFEGVSCEKSNASFLLLSLVCVFLEFEFCNMRKDSSITLTLTQETRSPGQTGEA